MSNNISDAHRALAAAHYYLNNARAKFCEAIDAADASGPGQPMNAQESAALDILAAAEQTALDAAEVLLDLLGSYICEDCLADNIVAPVATSN
jgi:hypothetical protein